MSSTVKWDLGAAKVLGTSKVTINTATTTNFNFGSPTDINLNTNTSYRPGDRVIVVVSGSTAGTTNNFTWAVQDAPDSSGSIGTPAAATLNAVSGALAATTGDDYSMFAVKLQNGRPWLRVSITSDGATDTFVAHCMVLSIPSNL